jgi:hypothetical protein
MSEEEARKYVGELFRIVSTTSILVIDRKGTLHRLNCPFRVLAVSDVSPDITEGKLYSVDAVKMSLDLKNVFIINGEGYFIWGFLILLDKSIVD